MTRTSLGFAFCFVCLLASFLLFVGANPLSAFFASTFSPNQELPLPNLAPIGGPAGPVAFVVRGLEPSTRADAQGGIYVSSIRGVPGGVDLHRWSPLVDPPPNSDGTLPFKYEGQPDNCGILTNGCANNVNNMLNPGVAPGGGDVDIATNAPDPVTNIPNLPLVSLLLAPGVTGTHSTDRGDSFSPPNVLEALISGDDRQWIDHLGYPISEQAKLEERWRRTAHNVLQLDMTLTDPKTYTEPWKSDTVQFRLITTTDLAAGTGWASMAEDKCVPLDEVDQYNRDVRNPAGGVPGVKQK